MNAWEYMGGNSNCRVPQFKPMEDIRGNYQTLSIAREEHRSCEDLRKWNRSNGAKTRTNLSESDECPSCALRGKIFEAGRRTREPFVLIPPRRGRPTFVHKPTICTQLCSCLAGAGGPDKPMSLNNHARLGYASAA